MQTSGLEWTWQCPIFSGVMGDSGFVWKPHNTIIYTFCYREQQATNTKSYSNIYGFKDTFLFSDEVKGLRLSQKDIPHICECALVIVTHVYSIQNDKKGSPVKPVTHYLLCKSPLLLSERSIWYQVVLLRIMECAWMGHIVLSLYREWKAADTQVSEMKEWSTWQVHTLTSLIRWGKTSKPCWGLCVDASLQALISTNPAA